MIDTAERISELERKLLALDGEVSVGESQCAVAQENYDAAKDAYAVAERRFLLAHEELRRKSEDVRRVNDLRANIGSELETVIACEKITREGGVVAEVVATEQGTLPQSYLVVVISVGKSSIKAVKVSEYRSLPKSAWTPRSFSVKGGGIWYAYGYKLKDHEAVIAEWKEKNP